jgi:ribose 5-phosphate isomerase A
MGNAVLTADQLKEKAALRALDLVRDGMRLGLGTGSTAAHFVKGLGARVADGLNVLCVPTSEATRDLAESHGIPLSTLDEIPQLDLTVDGADELDDQLRLIKGGGGALLIEKIVATASKSMVVIADDSKEVQQLGKFPLPVEVVPVGLRATQALIKGMASEAGCDGDIKLRTGRDGEPFYTDQENLILDCHFGAIPEPEVLHFAIKRLPGVVEVGLFLGIADAAIIAGQEGLKVLRSATWEEKL